LLKEFFLTHWWQSREREISTREPRWRSASPETNCGINCPHGSRLHIRLYSRL